MLVATEACPRCGGAMELKDDYDQGVRRGQQWSCLICSYSVSPARLNSIHKEKSAMMNVRPDTSGMSKRKAGEVLQTWYGEHKDEILADIARTNRSKTCEKWHMT